MVHYLSCSLMYLLSFLEQSPFLGEAAVIFEEEFEITEGQMERGKVLDFFNFCAEMSVPNTFSLKTSNMQCFAAHSSDLMSFTPSNF